MQASAKPFALLMIVMLALSAMPSIVGATRASSKPNGSSIIMDPRGDFVSLDPAPPTYSDIKKAQVVYQTGLDELIFTMNLAGVIPFMTSEDFIIYNWIIDEDLNGTPELLVTLSWTGTEWSSGVKEAGPNPSLIFNVEPRVAGSRIEVRIDKGALEEALGHEVSVFNWRAQTKFAPGGAYNWDLAPDGDCWGCWCTSH